MVSGPVLRKKWKYLRDQFSVECSKLKPSKSGDAANTTNEPKWPYYKQLLFLKDIVKPRASSSNLKPRVLVAIEDGEEDQRHEEAEGDAVTEQNIAPDDAGTMQNAPAENANPPTEAAEENRANQQKKRKRVATNALYNAQILQLEQQKIKTIENAFQREPESDDLLFFKSLLPFVSKIPIERKLRFRSRIQEVVEQFSYEASTQPFNFMQGSTSNSASYGNSTSPNMGPSTTS